MAGTDKKKKPGTVSAKTKAKKPPEPPPPAESEIRWAWEGLKITFSSDAPEIATGNYPLKDPAVFWTDEEHIYCRLNWELWSVAWMSFIEREEKFERFARAGRCKLISSIKNETAPIYHVEKLPDYIFKRVKKGVPAFRGTSGNALSKSDKPSEPQAKYMVLDLKDYSVSYLDDVPDGGWTDKYKTTKLVLRYIPAGSFLMGCREDDLLWLLDEFQHWVTLTSPFYIGVFQVTQKQYELITGKDPSFFKGKTLPVESVSYDDIRGKEKGAGWPENDLVDEDSFLGNLRAKAKLAFDLPTEAQWEYACRAGTTTHWNNGTNMTFFENNDPELDKLGCYSCNGGFSDESHKNPMGPAKVGFYQPNAWGLYDMHGNVWEWCLDWYCEYPHAEATDFNGAKKGKYREARGGSWKAPAFHCFSAFRSSYFNPFNTENIFGFRLVLVL